MNSIRKGSHACNKLRKANFSLKMRDAARARRWETDTEFVPKVSKKRKSGVPMMFSIIVLTICSFIFLLTCIAHSIIAVLNMIEYHAWSEIQRLVIVAVWGVMFGILFYLLCPIAWLILVECAQKCFRKKR